MRTRTLKNAFRKAPTSQLLNKIISLQARLAEAHFDVDAFMKLVVQEMQKLTRATGTVLELMEGSQLVYRAATGTVKKHLGLRLNIENSFSGLCIKSNKVLYSKDTEKDDRVNREACRLVKARSMVVAPLQDKGKPVGVLKIISSRASAFDASHVQILQLMAGLIGAALAHQIFYETTEQLLTEKTVMLHALTQAERKLQYQASHDYLTDLPNRALFQDELITAMHKTQQQNGLLSVIYMDIDHFKSINDTLGHSIGDALLQAFASRLKEWLTGECLAARFGGDEFVLLMGQVKNPQTALQRIEDLLQKIREPYTLVDRELRITSSIGMAFFTGGDITVDAFLNQADQALYAAKHAGRNTVQVYKTELLSEEMV